LVAMVRSGVGDAMIHHLALYLLRTDRSYCVVDSILLEQLSSILDRSVLTDGITWELEAASVGPSPDLAPATGEGSTDGSEPARAIRPRQARRTHRATRAAPGYRARDRGRSLHRWLRDTVRHFGGTYRHICDTTASGIKQ